MFRTANTLKTYKFLNLLSPVNLKVFSNSIRWKSTESYNENGSSAVGSSLRQANVPSIVLSVPGWAHGQDNWIQPYVTNRSSSECVEGAVNAVLSSPNSGNEIEKLPPIRHMPCDDLVAMLINFDDAGLPTHCRIMNTLLEEITDQTKKSKSKWNKIKKIVCEILRIFQIRKQYLFMPWPIWQYSRTEIDAR